MAAHGNIAVRLKHLKKRAFRRCGGNRFLVIQGFQEMTGCRILFPGFDPQYEGMDWSSLRLVIEKYNSEWRLVDLIHGEWTT